MCSHRRPEDIGRSAYALLAVALLVVVGGCNPPDPVSSARTSTTGEKPRQHDEVRRENEPTGAARTEERSTINSVASTRSPGETSRAQATPLPQFVGATVPTDALLRMLEEAPLLRFKSVGTSSIVFQTKLDAPVDGAFKPKTRMRAFGYQAEVAAFRLATLLGMETVPPAVLRRVAREDLRAKLQSRDEEMWSEIAEWTLWDDSGNVTGALIYWVPNMRSLPVSRETWEPWLKNGGVIPDDKRTLASDISSLLVFDYLIANWDRFSGGNLHASASGDRLVVRDHDVAFATPLPSRLHTRILEHVRRTERFSRSVIRNIEALTEARLRDAVTDARGQGALLSEAQIRDTLDRRAALLSYVRSLVAAHGEAGVYTFP